MAVRDLFRARHMQDYCEVLPMISRDVVWGESGWEWGVGGLRVEGVEGC